MSPTIIAIESTSMNQSSFIQDRPLGSVTRFSAFLLVAWIGFLPLAVAADEPVKITYEDHVKPIFREHCTSCHNANDKKSGLALDTYQAVMTGGSGGEVVAAGDLDSSRLYALTAHKEQPYMPPKQDMIPQAKVDLLKVWIEQGMPENSGSAIQKPKANSAALGMVSLARPEGAPPMPTSMIKQTPFFTPRAATISALAASPWSPLVAVGGQMQVALYHSETGQLQGIIPFPEGEPQSITFSRDGRLILIAGGRHSASGCAALHELATGNRIAKVGDELDIVFAADISDDNQLIAMAGPQKMVRVFETLSGNLKYEQKKHTDWIYCVRFSPDGLLLATADRASGLVVWETQTGRLFQELPGHKGEIRSIAWRPDSQALVSGSFDGTLKMWDMNEGKLIKSWDAHGGGVAAVAICNDGTIASTGRDNKVKVWDGAGTAAGEMPALVEAGHEVAITVDSKQVIAGDWAGNVRMWQRATPANEIRLAANPIPLEQSLAAAQQQLVQFQTAMQVTQTESVTSQTQQTSAKKQLTDLQLQIASTTTELQAAIELTSQLKSQSDAIVAQMSSKAAEFTSVQASKTEKGNQLSAAVAAKKTADDAINGLQSQRSLPGADIAGLDLQIANHNVQSQAQATAIAKFQTELLVIMSDFTARENQNAEMKTAFETKNSSFVMAAAKVLQVTANKVAAEQRIESATVALKAADEAYAAAQAKVGAASGLLATAQSQLDTVLADFARFTALPIELASKRTSIEQAIAAAVVQVEPAEAGIAMAMAQIEAASGELAKLEQQMASLQGIIVAEQQKRSTLQTEMTAKQQAVSAIRGQIQQSESELANAAVQQQLFEKAFGKK
jgi:WD40 repeat protein/mono/diheme cytochrome c family protein